MSFLDWFRSEPEPPIVQITLTGRPGTGLGPRCFVNANGCSLHDVTERQGWAWRIGDMQVTIAPVSPGEPK